MDLSEYVQKSLSFGGSTDNNIDAPVTLDWLEIVGCDTLNGTFGTVTATDLRSDQNLEWRKDGNAIDIRLVSGTGQIVDTT
ncbi:MAG: hypothetical protein ABJX32_04280 [Tateyamaria sp.]|uniref:hypothetical protein n=1 Tax=Tateyamaria sp. TaxID=1929288 RepID=UPI00329BD09F